MKKSVRFLAFAVLATSVFALAGCEDEHVHVDANHDGTCDTCQSMIEKDHVHTYEDVYSYDETNHWYASTCFHNVKSGVGAHDADEFGVCKVCGHKVGTPDVSTVAKALALATKQAGLVNGGTVETYTKTEYSEYTQFGSFDKGEDYLHTLNYYGYYNYKWTIEENWWSVVNDATVGFTRDGETGEMAWNNNEFEQEAVNGWFFDGNAFANIDKTYGVEDMLNMLYSAGSVGAMDGTWVDNGVVDGVYSFSFDYYNSDSSDNITAISVSFTLNEDCVVDSAVVKSELYYTDIEEGATLPVKPTDVDADETVVYTITQRTGDPATPAINPEEVLLSSFELYNGNEKVEDEITVDCGVETTLNLGDLLPESASDLTFEGFTFTGVDETTGEAIEISAYYGDYVGSYYEYNKTLGLTFKVLGTYTVTISSRVASKTITVNVVRPATTELNITVNETATTAKNLYLGKGFAFAVAANQYADNAHTIELTVADGSALTKDDLIYNEGTGLYVFTPDKVGTYVITATSTVNSELVATLTLEVSEKPDFSVKFTGMYEVASYWTPLLLEFVPDTVPATGKINVTCLEKSETVNYSYDKVSDVITLTHAEGATVILTSLSFDEDYNLTAVYAPGAPYQEQIGVLTVYTPPQPIDDVVGEYLSLVGDYPWANEGEGRYSLNIGKEISTLSWATYNNGWTTQETVSFKLNVTETEGVYSATITEIVEGSVTGFSIETAGMTLNVTEETDWWGDSYFIVTVGLTINGSNYTFEV